MRRTSPLMLSLAIALGLTLASSPALAQGKGKQHKDKAREERVDYRDSDRYPTEYGSGRYEVRGGNGSGKVPPGWCKGKGNPHNTPENCGYRGSHERDRRVYGDRDGSVRSRGGSYEQEHGDFHYYLDRKYSELARQRPLDVRWQVEIRARKKAEHDRWHAQMGRRH